jgi:hypothetical protein
VTRKGSDGEMQTEKVERKPPPAYLHEIAYAKIEDLESGATGSKAPDGSERAHHYDAPLAKGI